MKAERRQELRTNELSEQIEQVRSYVRENSTRLLATVIGIVVIVSASVWYFRGRESKVAEGWRQFQEVASATSPSDRVDQLKAIAQQDVDSALTLQAWLAVGGIARNEMLNPTGSAAVFDTGPDWSEIARAAYQEVLDSFPERIPPAGESMIALGTLAEDSGDFDKARTLYEKVIGDARFDNTPFEQQAEFRLEGLDAWSVPVVFPPPKPGPLPVTAAPTLIPTAAPTLIPTAPPTPAKPPPVPFEYPDLLPPGVAPYVPPASAAPPVSPPTAEPATNPPPAAGTTSQPSS